MRTLLATQTKRMRIVVLMLTGLLMLTTFSVAAGAEEAFIQEPDKDGGDAKAMIAFANLTLNGTSLSFFEVLTPDERVGGIAVSETVRSGRRGYGAVERLQKANALEIYSALSAPGTRIPRELIRLYGTAKLGKQGWALPLVDAGNPQEISCMVGAEPFGAFEDEVLSFGYPFVFLSEQDGPGTQPNHWFDDNGPADGTIRRQLQGGVDNKTHFFGKVSYCYEDLYEPTGFHGRYVSYKLRISDLFPTWSTVETGQLLDPGDSLSFHFTPSPDSASEFDFRMSITAAKLSDQFHIGATWANPGGTLTFGD